MQIDLKPFYNVVNSVAQPKTKYNKEGYSDFIFKHSRNNIFVNQIEIKYSLDTEKYIICEESSHIYRSAIDLENNKPDFILNSEISENYIQTFQVRQSIFSYCIEHFRIEKQSLINFNIAKYSENSFKVEMIGFVVNPYKMNLMALKEKYFITVLEFEENKFFASCKKLMEKFEETKIPNKFLSMCHVAIVELFTFAKSIYDNAYINFSHNLTIYYLICKAIFDMSSKFSAVYNSKLSPRLVPLVKHELHKLKLDDKGFYVNACNDFFLFLNRTSIGINISNFQEVTELLPVSNLQDLKTSINGLHSNEDFQHQLKQLYDKFISEIKNNIDEGPFDTSSITIYLKRLAERCNELNNLYSKVMVGNLDKSRTKKIDLSITTNIIQPKNKIDSLIVVLFNSYFDNEKTFIELLKKSLVDFINQNDEMAFEILQNENSNWRDPTDPGLAHYVANNYDIFRIVPLLKELTINDKIKYLKECRAEYNSNCYYQEIGNVAGLTFYEHINYWIMHLENNPLVVEKKLLHNTLLSNARSNDQIEISEGGLQENRLKWNDNLNVLADFFLKLTELRIHKKNIKYLEASPADLNRFIIKNFTDKNGKPIKEEAIKSYTAPSKEHKRPNKNKEIDVEQILKSIPPIEDPE